MLGCDGAAISEELTLHEVDGILPVNGIITHTNHILSPRLQHIPDYFRTNGSSFLRLCRADELLKGKKNIDQSYIRSVFSDHAGSPLGLQTILLFLIIQKRKRISVRETLAKENSKNSAFE